MKTDLRDATFLMAVRIDSVQRLENIKFVTDQICSNFDTDIMVLEASCFNNGILKSILNKKIKYQYIEDNDPVFYRTKYFNMMVNIVQTKYLSLWDADVVIDKKAIEDCMDKLKNQNFDVAYPYDGRFFNVPEIMRNFFFKKKDTRVLYKHINKMNLLYERILYGGAVFLNKEKFVEIGMENEMYYGWGNEDFDRHYRFEIYALKIFRANTCLFHLSHPRGMNSQFHHSISNKRSTKILFQVENSSLEELSDIMKKNSCSE